MRNLKKIATSSVLIKAHCGHYHPESECEVVIVKIIKGKNCELDAHAPLTEVFDKKVEVQEAAPAPITATEAPPVRQRMPMPPEIAALFVSPGDVNFETKGAKEIRKV